MKKLFLVAFLSCLTASVFAQVSVTATAGTAGPTTYTNLSNAFAAVNAGTHQGAITISIVGNTIEPASATTLLQSASPSNYTSIVVRPSGGNFTINSAASPTTNRGIIELNGADNVTIDGDDPSTSGTRNLTVQSALSSTIVACIRLSSGNVSGTNGANNVTVKNCILIGSRNSGLSVVASYGINLSNYSTTTLTTGAYSSLNTLLENNEIRRCYVGIYANGASVSYPNTGLIIRNNTIGSATAGENIGQRGIYVSNTSTATGSALLEGNDIRGGEYSGTGYSANVYGIEIAANNFGIRVIRNNIHDLQQSNTSGWAAIGVYISSATGNSSGFIQNNIIRDVVAANFSTTVSQYASHGIYSSVGFTGYAIDHNTIGLSTASSSGTVAPPFSSCVTLNSTLISLTSFRNNILVNSIASSNAYGLYTLATSNISGATVNNNDYFIPSGSVGFYNGSNAASLSTWKTSTGKDLNGISVNPPFISSTDLHLNVLNSGIIPFNGTGATGTGVTIDYDSQSRSASPDIGADEFALASCSGTPTVSSLTSNPTVQCGTGVFVLTVVPGAISEYTYQWQTSTNGGTSWNPVSGATQNVYTTGINTATQLYRCIITCTVSGFSVTSSSISATVSTNPAVTVTPSNGGVFCGSGTLTAAGATTYVWNSSPTLSSTTGAVVSSTASTLTTYTVTGTNAAGCSSQASITVGPPTIVINSSTPLFCETGGAISLIANSSIDPDIAYTWQVQTPSVTNITTSGYTLNCTISETSEFKVTGLGSGIYNGCVSYGYLSVGVYPLTQANMQTTSPVCQGTSVSVNSGLSASNYVFASRTYEAKTVPATAATLCTNGVSSVPLSGGNLDNGGWDNVPLGFSFNFFGNNYSSLAVSTNGFLIFGPVLGYGTTAGQMGQNVFSNLGGTFPNSNNPGNIIALMAGDHYFGNGTNGSATGDIYYWTEGYSPNRRFVLYYKDVNACCSASTPTFSARVVLYETLGIVDVFIDNNLQSGPNSVGVQNGSKTIGISPTGLDYFSNSITTSQAWRMFPPTNFLTTWNQNSVAGNTQIASGYNLFSQTVTPLVTTTYSLQYTNTLTGCSNGASPATAVVTVIGTTAPTGVTTSTTAPSVCNPETFTLSTNYTGSLTGITLNWQSSLNGTSWTNISGATSSTLTTTHSTQSYYRLQFISCGGTPSYSSSIVVGHSCGIPGCTVVSACNYNANATINDGSCVAATTWYLDADTDGYYVSQTTSCTNPGVGFTVTLGISGDCNDSNSAVHVGVTEVCNGFDDNCNSSIDEGLSTSNTTTASACNSYTWSVNGITYSTSGTYSVTSGCHTEVLSLTITPSTSNTTTASACGSYTWSVNGQTYTSSGTYTSVSGCHTEILSLTITANSSNTTTVNACSSYTWSVNGQTYTTGGTYTSVTGCHTEILVLTITSSSSNSTTISACDSYVWSVNGITYTTSGTYTSVSGCHTEILNLTIFASSSNTSTVSACGSYTWPLNAQTYTTGGTYSVVSGCHTEILVLTITPLSSNTTNATSCDSYTWSVSGLVYTTSGTYSVVSGCHTEILSLIINTSTVYYVDADGDGYGTSATANFCSAPVSGYSLVTGDCNDSQFAINPGASEDCFNAVDDNCDGNINEGCLSAVAGEEPYNAILAPSAMYSYCSSFYSTLAGSYPSTLAQSTCITGEDRWYNFTTLSTGVTIFIGSNANDIVIELQDANGNLIDVENSVVGIGTEVLTKTGLTLGATYRVGIRNYNSNAQAGGQFSGCIRHLRAGGSDSGTSAAWPSTIGMCNVFKAAYCGGTGVQYRFTWTGLTGIAAGQVYTKTQTSDYLTITSVTPMLPAGSMYNVLVTAIYTIPNGAGANEVFEMPASTPTTITISSNPLTSLRTSDQCTSGPRYRGAIVASLPWVCGVSNWRWRFTEVNPLNLQTVGLPIEQNRGAASNYITLTSVTALQYGKTYAVQTSPIYTYTGTNYQWGPVTYMCIIGSAGLIVDASQDVSQDAMQDRQVEDVTQDASQGIELSVYPNPTNGEGVTMTLSGL
ncbi:MAG: beta strand repeat-containing protein, partial [Sediminibacterium sp.]